MDNEHTSIVDPSQSSPIIELQFMGPSKKAKLVALNGDISFLPFHILEDILLRLDRQTLFRCALVCKDWNNLITSPDFISRITEQTFNSRSQILLMKVCPCPKSASYYARIYTDFPYCRLTYSLHWDNDQFSLFCAMESPNSNDFKGTRVVGVSNGLTCLVKKQPFRFMLLNPTIQKYVQLLLITFSLGSVGFGFDRCSNDFKFVNFIYHNGQSDQIVSAWVFSFVTWSWKHLKCSIPPSFELCYAPVCFNGVLHWIGRLVLDNELILTFDLAHKVVGHIPLPGDLGTNMGSLNYIVTTGDSLGVVQLIEVLDEETGDYPTLILSSWIMKEYGNPKSWTNIFSISTKEIKPQHILGMSKNGNVILEVMNGGALVCRYNPITSTNVLVEAMKNNVYFWYDTESLYLVGKKGLH